MRLIDADKLEPHGIYNGVEYRDVVYLDDIKKMPTISKYKRILRCKDCKYWNKHHFVDIYVCSIHNKEGQYPYLLFEMSADDFCSRGEKK